MKKNNSFYYIGFYLSLILLSAIRAIAIYMFIIPNGFAPGGLTGIASIMYNLVLPFNEKLANTWFNPSITFFVLNIPLIIWAFKVLQKKFVVNSLIGIILFSLFFGLCSLIDFPQFIGSTYESGIMLLASLVGGVISGLGFGLMLKMNVCNGGTEIVGKIIYKLRPVVNVQWFIFICDFVVVMLSGLVGILSLGENEGTKSILAKVLSPILYSFISLYAFSKAADLVQVGFESSVVFNVITSKPQEIGDAIVAKVKRSATIIKGQGVFTKENRNMLICVVRRKQIVPLKKLILEMDENAFTYITNTREVNGFGFRPNIEK